MNILKYTNKGQRDENQDYVIDKVLSDSQGVFVVADGMGGYKRGDVAAQIVGNSIVEYVVANIDKIDPTELLKNAVRIGNDALMNERMLSNEKMGAVIVVLLVIGNDSYFTWLGDSRLYMYREGIEVYRTEDHSLINKLRKRGTISVETYKKYESIVTRSIMGEVLSEEIEVCHIGNRKGDIFVMCTDGFYKEISMDMALQDEMLVEFVLDGMAETVSDNYSFIRVEI